MESVLPKGWIQVESRVLFKQLRGVSYDKADATQIKTHGFVLVLRGGNIQDGKIINQTDNVYVPFHIVNKSQFLQKGDVIIVSSTGSKQLIGKASFSKESQDNVCFGAFLTLLRPSPHINSSYFGYFYQSNYYREKIRELSGGININNIRKEHLEQIIFPLAPLSEQTRIVAKLDALFAHIETLKNKLDRIPELLKSFRQQVLTQAVTGKLTEEWRKGKELEEWKQERLKKISERITVGFVGKITDQYVSSGVPLLRSQNVRAFKFSKENLLYISKEFHKQILKSKLEPGDVAIVRSGYPGTTCVIPDELVEANCSDILVLSPIKELLNPHYVAVLMNSDFGKSIVFEGKVGIAQQHFNTKVLSETEIPLPPLEEQNEIACRVQELFLVADTIEARYKSLKVKIDTLPQAILTTAFKGKLVKQDPNDEPASVMLERIRQKKGEIK